MKVLHLAAGNLFGGVETYLLTLARLRHLCPEMEPHFGLCFPGRLRDELTATGVPVHDLGAVRASRPWRILRARRQLKSTINQHHISAVVTHGTWAHAMFAPAAHQAGARVVNLVHDYPRGFHWIDRWARRTPPDMAIANSQFTSAAAKELFPHTPVEVVYYPVISAQPTHSIRGEIRASLKTSDSDVVILQASRLERWKGQAVHIDALARLKDVPGWVAWIAGGPQKAGEAEFLAELKAATERHGIADRVRFLGQRSDVSKLMSTADIYCQPNSGPEPFGIVFVEALYAGLPTISSNFGGAAEIVTEACGILCPPGDSVAVAKALESLVQNPTRRQALGQAGPDRVSSICDASKQMSRFTAVLRSR